MVTVHHVTYVALSEHRVPENPVVNLCSLFLTALLGYTLFLETPTSIFHWWSTGFFWYHQNGWVYPKLGENDQDIPIDQRKSTIYRWCSHFSNLYVCGFSLGKIIFLHSGFFDQWTFHHFFDFQWLFTIFNGKIILFTAWSVNRAPFFTGAKKTTGGTPRMLAVVTFTVAICSEGLVDSVEAPSPKRSCLVFVGRFGRWTIQK